MVPQKYFRPRVHLTVHSREHWSESEIFWPKFSKIEKSFPLKHVRIKKVFIFRFIWADLAKFNCWKTRKMPNHFLLLKTYNAQLNKTCLFHWHFCRTFQILMKSLQWNNRRPNYWCSKSNLRSIVISNN